MSTWKAGPVLHHDCSEEVILQSCSNGHSGRRDWSFRVYLRLLQLGWLVPGLSEFCFAVNLLISFIPR